MNAYDNNYGSFCGIDFDAGNNVWGLTMCFSLYAGTNRCDHHGVYFDQDDVDANGASWMRGLACHELGHSIGLQHRNNNEGIDYYNGCMFQYGNPQYKTVLSGHDQWVITNNY